MENIQSKRNYDLSHYLGVIIREYHWFFGVFGLVTVLGIGIIIELPKVYSARAEILIEQESMHAIGKNENRAQNLSHRIQSIVKTILTNENIDKILRKHMVLNDGTPKEELYKAYELFRKSTKLDFINAVIVNPVTGREGMVSLGVSITHENKSAERAYEITNNLTDLLLSENAGKVTAKGSDQLAFLEKEKANLFAELKQVEGEMATFKEANSLYLPEIHTVAIRRYQDLKSEFENIDDKISFLKKSEYDVLANVATTNANSGLYTSEGTRIVGARDKLVILQQQYEQLSSEFTSMHPDIIKLKEDIAALKRSITAMRQNQPGQVNPSNPAQMLLRARLDGLRSELQQEISRKLKTQEELKQVEIQIQKMPRVKEELKLIELKQESVLTKYRKIEDNLVQVSLSSEMRDANLLENFILSEPAHYPVSPIKPRKKILLVVLLLLATSLAYLVALLKDMYNDRIMSRNDFIKYVDEPIYVIPKV